MKKVFLAIALLGLMSCKSDDENANCDCDKKFYETKVVTVNGLPVFRDVLIKIEKVCEPAGRVQTGKNTFYLIECR